MRPRSDRADSSGGFEPVEFRQADVHEDQIGLQFLRLIDSFQSVRHLNDVVFRSLFERPAYKRAERFEIFNDEDGPGAWHRLIGQKATGRDQHSPVGHGRDRDSAFDETHSFFHADQRITLSVT